MTQHRPLRRAVYAGSFDPPTNGHLWMIQQAQSLFDELIVAIGENPDKACTYSIKERAEMLQELVQDYPNVCVTEFKHLFLSEYAKMIGAEYIVRGIRTSSDYEYERSMRYINSDFQPAITTIFLMPPREFAEVSSTMVKGLVGPDNWQEMVKRYVPEAVYKKLLKGYLHEEHH